MNVPYRISCSDKVYLFDVHMLDMTIVMPNQACSNLLLR